ncbi:MAG: hypothetical protein M4D80_20515 [Myxococcota bacterium]|nr:hypothetical protein [Myxococcota bacterium]
MSPAADEEVTDILAAWTHRFEALRAQLAAATGADDGSVATRQAHIDASIALIVALVDELEEEQADAEIEALVPLVMHDVRLEIETRRRLAIEMVGVSDRERALVQLRAAHALARGTDLETEVGIALAVALRDHERHAEARVVLDAAPAAGTPEVAAQLALSRASVAEGAAAEALCRSAVASARKTNDVALMHATAVALAELLAAREELVEAEALLEDLPSLDDALETRALLEEIWRRLGSHLVDEADEADEPGEMDRQLRAYITKPRSFAQALVDGGLASPDRIREWSYGELREPADLESQRIFGPVRSFWCACGRYRGRAYAGIVCRRCGVEVVHAAARRMRAGHIALATPVVHPWYATAAAQLLDRQVDDVGELRTALGDVDLERLADDLKRAIVTAPKARIADVAGKRLALVEAFRTARKQAYTRPEHVILDIVPVVPPHGELDCDREKVRAAYAQLLEGADPNAAVRALFDAFSAR